jgi:hypothetical protein
MGNCLDGNGKKNIRYTNGDFYRGYMINHLKNGYGVYIYNNGDIYEGYWKDNKQHGIGTMTYVDGTHIKNIWVDGRVGDIKKKS